MTPKTPRPLGRLLDDTNPLDDPVPPPDTVAVRRPAPVARPPLRVKLTTALDHNLLTMMRELAQRDGTHLNTELEEAVRKHLAARGMPLSPEEK